MDVYIWHMHNDDVLFSPTQHLHSLHCYNTLLAVVGGLNHFSVRRLNQTWVHVDKVKKEELTTWTEFFSSQMNYSKYRQTVIALNGGFHIPVMYVHLSYNVLPLQCTSC